MRPGTWQHYVLVWLIAAMVPCSAHAVISAPEQAAGSAQQEWAAALRAKPDVGRGHRLFDTCAACHQETGAGATDGTVPAIAAQHYRVVVRELINFRRGQRADERMQHFTDAHHLEDAQAIADVAAYISHLPANHSLGEGSGVSIEHGKQLYAGACASCHGVSAEGDASNGYPRLAGQHYLYLLRVFFETPDEEWGDFSSTHGSLLNNLQRSDKTALADYLSRLDR